MKFKHKNFECSLLQRRSRYDIANVFYNFANLKTPAFPSYARICICRLYRSSSFSGGVSGLHVNKDTIIGKSFLLFIFSRNIFAS